MNIVIDISEIKKIGLAYSITAQELLVLWTIQKLGEGKWVEVDYSEILEVLPISITETAMKMTLESLRDKDLIQVNNRNVKVRKHIRSVFS